MVLLGGCVVLALLNFSSAPPSTPQPQAPPRPTVVPGSLAEFLPNVTVTREKLRWSGGIMKADIMVTTQNTFAIKDVLLECAFFGKSGTELHKRRETVYEIVGASKSELFKNVDLGVPHSQANAVSCRVVYFKRG